jgi:hypothetical protein
MSSRMGSVTRWVLTGSAFEVGTCQCNSRRGAGRRGDVIAASSRGAVRPIAEGPVHAAAVAEIDGTPLAASGAVRARYLYCP